MSKHYDVIIIGAGPAGMSAAYVLSQSDTKVCVLDEQPAAGGQIYRAINQSTAQREKILGPDYSYGKTLSDKFHNADIDYISGASAWQATAAGEVNYSRGGKSYLITAERLLLATGAQERPMPFPGWTLPGVMPCGAAQILLKSSGIKPSTPVVIAGSGPLIFLIAAQFIKADVKIQVILDTTPKANYIKAARHVLGAYKGYRHILKGLNYINKIKQAGVEIQTGISQLKATPSDTGFLKEISYHQSGHLKKIESDLLLTHMGVVPNLQLSRSMGCQHIWNEQARNWDVDCEVTGRTTHSKIFVAGDGNFIMGAKASEYSARLAAYEILKDLGKFDPDKHTTFAEHDLKTYHSELAIRPFINVLYKPSAEFLVPPDETIICRCEEIKVKDIRDYAKLGCLGPNQTKAFGRSGMGPCQGRQCGLAVSEILADVHKTSPEKVGYYNIRSPIKPMSLGEISCIAQDDE